MSVLKYIHVWATKVVLCNNRYKLKIKFIFFYYNKEQMLELNFVIFLLIKKLANVKLARAQICLFVNLLHL